MCPEQASLFATEPITVFPDAEGGVRYWPGRVSPQEQQCWFETLREALPWRSERRQMYERMLDVPRLQASLTLAEACELPVLRQALQVVREIVDAPFTHVGFNLYRNGDDSVAMHNDRLHSLQPGQPIALLSLGAARDMVLRAKQFGQTGIRICLEPGSVLLMSHASQLTHAHGIPKTRDAVGARISCAFRVRHPGHAMSWK